MKCKARRIGQMMAVTLIRCAIYTRKSTEEGLDQEFNTLDAQRESAEAYIESQKAEGWVCLPEHYDDGGFTGANMERPRLKRLIADIKAGLIDCVVVYKVDRFTRSLLDFARLVELFEKHQVSFVSVTQQFNTTHSMGRLMLNVLLSFAQFEREIIAERTRDKIAATRRKGKWAGGHPLLGYDVVGCKLIVNVDEAERVRLIFVLYLENQSLTRTTSELNRRGWTTKGWTTHQGQRRGAKRFTKTILSRLLSNVVYRGMVRYKDEIHPGEHRAIIDEDLFQRVQTMLHANGRAGGMHVRNTYGALLKGLLRCQPCACAMTHTYTSKGNRRYRYYTCATVQKQGWHACPSKSVPAEQIEQFVVEQIRTIGKDSAVRSMVLDQARAQASEEAASVQRDVDIIEREIRDIHHEIKKVSTTVNGHTATRLVELHDRLREAEPRLSELRDQAARSQQSLVSKAAVDSALTDFAALWDALNPREQARVVQLLVQRVDYDGAKGKIAVTFHANGIRTLGQNGVAKLEATSV